MYIINYGYIGTMEKKMETTICYIYIYYGVLYCTIIVYDLLGCLGSGLAVARRKA